jgi:hypothetical protein
MEITRYMLYWERYASRKRIMNGALLQELCLSEEQANTGRHTYFTICSLYLQFLAY